MEMMMTKDFTACLPIAVATVPTASANAVSRSASPRQAEKKNGGFSQKLSAAMDSPASANRKEHGEWGNTAPVNPKNANEKVAEKTEEKNEGKAGEKTGEKAKRIVETGGPAGAASSGLLPGLSGQAVLNLVDVLPENGSRPVELNSSYGNGANGAINLLAQKNSAMAALPDEALLEKALVAGLVSGTKTAGAPATDNNQLPKSDSVPATPVATEVLPKDVLSTQPAKVPSMVAVTLARPVPYVNAKSINSEVASPIRANEAAVSDGKPTGLNQDPAVGLSKTSAFTLPQALGVSNSADPKVLKSIVSMRVTEAKENVRPPLSQETVPEADTAPPDLKPQQISGLGQTISGQPPSGRDEGGMPDKSLGQGKAEFQLQTDAHDDPTIPSTVTFGNGPVSNTQVETSAGSAPQAPQLLHDVARQVMDGMTASTERMKSSQVIITLKPEHLGEVTVRINVDGDKVTAAFHAASSEVRAILESSLPQLRQQMSQQGWKFDSDGVYSGMKEFFSNQHHQPQSQEPQIPQLSHRSHRDLYDVAASVPETQRVQVMNSAAVDYRI